MIETIKNALYDSGIEYIPDDYDANLENYGVDSLIVVLAILKLEKKLDIKIATREFHTSFFQSINSIKKHLEKLLEEKMAS